MYTLASSRGVALLFFCLTHPQNAASPSLRGNSQIIEVTAEDLARSSRTFNNEVDLLIVDKESPAILMEWAEKIRASLKTKLESSGKPIPVIYMFSLPPSGKLPKLVDESADEGNVQWETLKLPNVGLFFYGSLKRWFRVQEGTGCGGEPDNPQFVPELIAAWAVRRSFITPMRDAKELAAFQSEHDVSVVGFGVDSGMDRSARDAFAGVMRNAHDRAVSSTGFAKADADLLPGFIGKSQRAVGFAIVLSNNRYDPPKQYEFSDYENDNVYFSMLNWVQDHSDPPILPARHCTEEKWNKGNLIKEDVGTSEDDDTALSQLLAVFIFPHQDSLRPRSLPWFKQVERFASEFQNSGNLVALVDNEDQKTATTLRERFDLVDADTPCVRLELQRFSKRGEYGRKPSNLHFRCDFGDPINNLSETVESCARAYYGGGLQPYFKSEAVPDYLMGPVQDIVGSTFDSIVLTPGRDVVVLFCTPWCGFCKKFEPIFRELAANMQQLRPWIAFGKMDFTRNDNRVFDFWTSPQLHIFQAYYKDDPVYYDIRRDQSEKAVESWVMLHTRKKPSRSWHPEVKNHSDEAGLLGDEPVQIGTPGEL